MIFSNSITKLKTSNKVSSLFPRFSVIFRILKFFRARNFYNHFSNLKNYHLTIINDFAHENSELDRSEDELQREYTSIWKVPEIYTKPQRKMGLLRSNFLQFLHRVLKKSQLEGTYNNLTKTMNQFLRRDLYITKFLKKIQFRNNFK